MMSTTIEYYKTSARLIIDTDKGRWQIVSYLVSRLIFRKPISVDVEMTSNRPCLIQSALIKFYSSEDHFEMESAED